MTVKVIPIPSPRRYNFLSTDTKPADTAEGTEGFEVNTGVKWIYHNGEWYENLELFNALKLALAE